MTLIDVALSIRAESEKFLVSQCILRKYTGFATIDGEYQESFVDSVNIPCRVINKTGKSNTAFGSQDEQTRILVNVQSTQMQLPYNTEVSTKDKLIFDSVTYDITSVPIKHALMGAFIIAIEKQK